jgi:hypothetical protein
MPSCQCSVDFWESGRLSQWRSVSRLGLVRYSINSVHCTMVLELLADMRGRVANSSGLSDRRMAYELQIPGRDTEIRSHLPATTSGLLNFIATSSRPLSISSYITFGAGL